MHIVILAIRITCSWCTRVPQNDRTSNPVSKKTEESMLSTKRLPIMSDLKSTYFHRPFMIIKKSTTKASFHSLRLLHKQCSQRKHNQLGAICPQCQKTQLQKLPKIQGTSVLKPETTSVRNSTAVPTLYKTDWGGIKNAWGILLTDDPNQQAPLP